MAVPQLAPLHLLDANALVSLGILLRERSVTRAAKRQGVSQSAMSQTLGRLRDTLGDRLLVRSGASMVLTPRAEALREPLIRIFGELERVLADEPAFDPRASKRRVQIGISDYAALLLLPTLIGRLSQEAPGVDIAIVNIATRSVINSVRDGRIDVAIGFIGDAPGLTSQPLWRDDFVVLMRKAHPLAKRRLNPKSFANARHLLVSPQGTPRGRVDDVLATTGLSRRVYATLPYFLAAPAIVTESDVLLTISRKIAERFLTLYKLVLCEPPIALGSFPIAMTTSTRLENDPVNRWLRQQVAAAAACV